MSKPDFMRGVYIPPQPKIIADVQGASPDLELISQLIAKDSGIAANILRVVNSPAFNLPNKIASVCQGVTMLGLDSVINIINGLMIRVSFEKRNTDNLVEFWALNEDIAACSAYLSRKLGLGDPEWCYLLGLFHMCGVPALYEKVPEYKTVFAEALLQTDLTVENYISQHAMLTHAAVGYFIAHTWNLPKDICYAIAGQLDVEHISAAKLAGTREQMLVLKMAQLICQWDQRLLGVNATSDSVIEFVLSSLTMSEDDYEDLRDEVSSQVLMS